MISFMGTPGAILDAVLETVSQRCDIGFRILYSKNLGAYLKFTKDEEGIEYEIIPPGAEYLDLRTCLINLANQLRRFHFLERTGHVSLEANSLHNKLNDLCYEDRCK